MIFLILREAIEAVPFDIKCSQLLSNLRLNVLEKKNELLKYLFERIFIIFSLMEQGGP